MKNIRQGYFKNAFDLFFNNLYKDYNYDKGYPFKYFIIGIPVANLPC